VRADGSREWWVDGKLHRRDGPAVEDREGYREWWVDGVQYPSAPPFVATLSIGREREGACPNA
jgi:hypothetical protein